MQRTQFVVVHCGVSAMAADLQIPNCVSFAFA